MQHKDESEHKFDGDNDNTTHGNTNFNSSIIPTMTSLFATQRRLL